MNRSWGADPPLRRPGHGLVGPGRIDLAQITELAGVGDPEVTDVQYPRHLRLADELAPMVEVWERLLVLHLPDRTGRCRTCTQGGTGLPGTPWPCALHGIAELARRRHGRVQGA